MKRWLLSFLTFLAVGALAAEAGAQSSPPSSEKSQYHRPDATQAGRASLVVAADLAADQGVGLSADYDIPLIAEAGPGRLLLGPSATLVFASDDNAERLDCEVTHRERVFAAAANLRYVLDLHEKVRPWASAGLGLYYVQHAYHRNEPCAWDVDDTDTEIGPGLALGLGLDVDLTPASMVTFGLLGHEADEEFATLSIGLGWRF